MHRQLLKQKALHLRQAGYSYTYIASKTGLSKSTLSEWLSGVPYTPNQETIRTIGKARARAGARKTEIKQESFAEARDEAVREIGFVSQRDIFMFGLGLYLGEGNKTHDLVRIVNSDPEIIRLAIVWFESLGLSKKHFAITLHLYPDSDPDKSRTYWSNMTDIPKSQFLKTQIDWRKDKKAYKIGKLPHGTAQLSVRGLGEKRFGVFLARKIHAWNEELIQKTKMRV